mgnify:CR=1 FL=1
MAILSALGGDVPSVLIGKSSAKLFLTCSCNGGVNLKLSTLTIRLSR